MSHLQWPCLLLDKMQVICHVCALQIALQRHMCSTGEIVTPKAQDNALHR